MKIETIATGDELLTGLTSDTNSRYFQNLLLERTGLTVRRGVIVGDDKADIIEALNTAAARADVVLVSGGLGPTSDDLTAECAAEAEGVPVVLDPAVIEHVERRARERNLVITDINRLQARAPLGAEVVLNQEGSAPLIIQKRGRCTFFYVPGVPREYRHLVGTHVVTRIAAMKQDTGFRRLALLKTVGLPESQLDLRVRPLQAEFSDVVFGYRTHPPENHLKLLAVGDDEAKVLARLEAVVARARALLGAHVFARDEESMASVLHAKLKGAQQRLAVAESCTGGLIAELLTAHPGISEVLYGSAVTYAEAAKTQWANVPEGLLGQYGAVSSQCAEAMASGIRSTTNSTWGLSTTGYAGPGGGDEKHPVGTVFLGVSGPSGTKVERHHFFGDRERVRSFAAWSAMDLLRRTMEGLP